MSGLKPAASCIEIGEDGKPVLRGTRCTGCGAVFLGERLSCGHCGAMDGMRRFVLGARGTLYSFTIVHRSYPGVRVPFISAIVDLEGGGTVKGNLLEVEPNPAAIAFDMPVDMVFRDAGFANPEAAGHVAYFFVPAQGDGGAHV